MNAAQTESLKANLAYFSSHTSSAEARVYAEQIAAFFASAVRPWSRATLEGHLTASAWVIDRSGSYAAMIHHRTLGRWLQPGGHIEDADVSWRAAAQREVTEEIGLDAFVAMPDDHKLFDVDVHRIPMRPGVPAHFHYDLRFLFVADVDASLDAERDASLKTNVDEAHDCRWFRLADLADAALLEPSLRRMVELSVQRFL